MDVEKICRTCLGLAGPFLSIYEGENGSRVVDMLREISRMRPRLEDKLPPLVCLTCISEINHCYSFKLKCENSNRTLRQLVPNALPEETTDVKPTVMTGEMGVQTENCTSSTATVAAQTEYICSIDVEQNTVEDKEVPLDEEHAGPEHVVEFDYEFSEHETEETPAEANAENIILHIEKDNMEFETEMVYNKNTGEVQTVDTNTKQKAYNFRLFSNGNGGTFLAPDVKTDLTLAQPVTTRKRAAKLLQQQIKTELLTPDKSLIESPSKRNTRRRIAAHLEEQKPQPSIQSKQGVASPRSNFAKVEKLQTNYHCDRCNAGFALKKSLLIHIRQNGCTNRNFKCNECERVFVSMDHLTEHQATHTAHSCPACGLRWETKEQLGKHMVQAHKRNLRNQCNVCQKVFTMLSTLRDHMRIHTGEKPFVCNVCGKGFTQNANMRQHKLRHSDIKRFKCDLCINSFVTKAELSSHERTHTGVKPFECDVCSARFTTSCSLAKHKRKHTGERPYGCDLCPMRFTALNVLKNHRRTHTGERPYVCPFCSRSFTQRGDCQVHQRTHEGDRIYSCPVCSQEFKAMNEMRMHLTLHEHDDKRLMQFTLKSDKENDAVVEEDEEEEEEDEEEQAEDNESDTADLL
ncbi:CG6654 [Drosophila busckii]|uniref:CG6654 n=1 Tax=Drosophila busckii TaxID=30019 RepID=A0A0M5JD32_DROBS|nr:zinc finger protein 570 [Drosophila busckii]ALC47994.1 CG6654 [Drosophila busckii]